MSPNRARQQTLGNGSDLKQVMSLVDAAGPTIVEGPFARNPEYIAMLKAITDRSVYISAAVTGTSVGAAILFSEDPSLPELAEPEAVYPLTFLKAYADQWMRMTLSV